MNGSDLTITNTTGTNGVPATAFYTPKGVAAQAQPPTANTSTGLDFDAKGVDFAPWIRPFIAQVRHNWNVPLLAQSLSGHVVITFTVHADGTLTDITLIKPSVVDAFNDTAIQALRTSSPTLPLPKEYPSDHCVFTVTFYYNERPPGTTGGVQVGAKPAFSGRLSRS
jgi:TonB family protein